MTVIKNLFKFIAGGIFSIFRIPLIIIGVALVVGIFNIKIMACIIHIDFGVVIMAMPMVFTGKTLVENITVFRKGERFSGTCTGYKLEHWNSGYDVYWTDNNNTKLHRRFDVPIIRFRYPFTVNVYSLNKCINLGIFTIVKNILYFSVCLFVWIVCTGITADNVCKTFIY